MVWRSVSGKRRPRPEVEQRCDTTPAPAARPVYRTRITEMMKLRRSDTVLIFDVAPAELGVVWGDEL